MVPGRGMGTVRQGRAVARRWLATAPPPELAAPYGWRGKVNLPALLRRLLEPALSLRWGDAQADFPAWPWRWTLQWVSAGIEAVLRNKTLGPYIDAARKMPSSRRPARGSRPARPGQSEVRAWAREQGLKVSDWGRIPADVLASYESAH